MARPEARLIANFAFTFYGFIMFYQEDWNDTAAQVHAAAHPLNKPGDLDGLMKAIGEARFVLLGESTHGTHEFYTWRSQLTRRLIAEKNFSFIAVEGDWPDFQHINDYVKGRMDDSVKAADLLHAFRRWPTWMWANWETAALAEWLKQFNDEKTPRNRVGIYGLDVYSLQESLEYLDRYLSRADPDAQKLVADLAQCFDRYGAHEGYGYALGNRSKHNSCAREAAELLLAMLLRKADYNSNPEAGLQAEQNARIAVNAERYYRTMVGSGPASWNIRDRHMHDTLNLLIKHHGPEAKAIVWQHNTHIGDARATDMAMEGMISLGQLVMEEHADLGVFRIGFGTNGGTVCAADRWGGIMRQMPVPYAPAGTWEQFLHQYVGKDAFLLTDEIATAPLLRKPILHRAIGVVYHPGHEFPGNYVPSVIPMRYEAFVYLDQTSKLHAMHVEPDGMQIPETFPWGM
jgi:erythromycin esterase-like protein